jgi:ribosome biogenesis protein Nip4
MLEEVVMEEEIMEEMMEEEEAVVAAVAEPSKQRRKTREELEFLELMALQTIDRFSDVYFRRHFRMGRASFETLLSLVAPKLWVRSIHDRFVYSPRIKLHVTLRWLAGGQYQDLGAFYGISTGR